MAVRDVVQAAAGVGGGGEYVEDVFSTYLYTGNGSAQTINNGIDLDGEGGLVWVKGRTGGSTAHCLVDTVRGVNNVLLSYDTAAQFSQASVNSFTSNGFTVPTSSLTNTSSVNYASWTLRKSPKFFDVVTWTGDGVAGRTVAHNLGSVPGCIIVKRTNAAENWFVYHHSLTASNRLQLNTTDETTVESGPPYQTWNQEPTDSVFYVGSTNRNNGAGSTYVAYVFAHDAGGFGDDGEQNVISCGSYVGNGSSTGPVITLGWEPQWVLIKDTTSGVQDWILQDTMRGMTATSGVGAYVKPNTSSAEFATSYVTPQPTGFQINQTSGQVNTSGNTYIYIAIRRPMKKPEAGTEVFSPLLMSGTVGDQKTTGWPVDTQIVGYLNGGLSQEHPVISRLTGVNTGATQSAQPFLSTSQTAAEATASTMTDGWNNTGYKRPDYWGTGAVAWNFKRAPGFMDVVAYTGTGVAKTEAHNLGVVPELIIVKCRSNSSDWGIYSKSLASAQYLVFRNPAADTNDALFGFGYPSATTFNVDRIDTTNFSGRTYIAYLFASLPGVSKVGSYTGTGSDLNVDCGFSAGARFILIKRTDSTGDWYVWDSARGIVAGNDPYLLLNSTAAEVTSTDYIDPLASGFTVTSSAPAALNASGGNYIFLAIA